MLVLVIRSDSSVICENTSSDGEGGVSWNQSPVDTQGQVYTVITLLNIYLFRVRNRLISEPEKKIGKLDFKG